MKYLKLFFIAALSMFTICSCTDSNIVPEEPVTPVTPDEPDEPEVPDTTANYLVMYFGVGGGNLDPYIVPRLFRALDEGSSEKVKMTFQVKLSYYYQNFCHGFQGVRRFTADDNAHYVGKVEELLKDGMVPDKPYEIGNNKLETIFTDLKTDSIGDLDYDMVTPECLADFIKWSKEKYPNTKRTILILNNHGRGWDITDDGIKDYGKAGTRGILYDNNNKTHMSLNDVVNGIKQGGNVDVMFLDACLMNMYENLYGYASCCKYLVSGVEPLPALAGDFRTLLKMLKEASGTNETDIVETMKKYVDHHLSKEWWGQWPDMDCDLSCINLTKLDQITTVMKKTVDTLVEKFCSSESINPTATELLFGDTFAPYIRMALVNCELAESDEYFSFFKSGIPTKVLRAMMADRVTTGDGVNLRLAAEWLRVPSTDGAKEIAENYPDEWLQAQIVVAKHCYVSYVFTDLLRNIDKELDAVGAQNNPFKQLRKEMLDALKSIAYITCTTNTEIPGVDQAYELCSPGLAIIPFTEESYKSPFNARISDSIPSVQDAVKIYQNLEFDKQVGWSRFLQLVDVTPSALFNPRRKFVK